jgi:hypothetical protein
MHLKLKTADIKRIGIALLGLTGSQLSRRKVQRVFRTCFGCSILVVTVCWNLLVERGTVPEKGVPKHLFWALSLLKCYETESFYSTWFHVDPGTFRKWAWAFIGAISSLEIVSISKY